MEIYTKRFTKRKEVDCFQKVSFAPSVLADQDSNVALGIKYVGVLAVAAEIFQLKFQEFQSNIGLLNERHARLD